MKALDSFTVEEIEEIISSCQQEIHNTPTSDEFPVSPRLLLSLARIALAAKRAEPDYYIVKLKFNDGWGDETVLDTYETKLDATKSKADHGGEITPAYTTPQLNYPEIPEGWKLVPTEPTQNMVDAHISGMQLAGFSRAYRDMLAAAPEKPL
ncbi:hypothetical protein [Yersinia aldovae]|uniref:hypothetical protein n=1 Tax=Yersinia aldovae TaxID=29483 RepID=UPI0011A56D60|nr:hypothetical protein [Yersinia aldovae]